MTSRVRARSRATASSWSAPNATSTTRLGAPSPSNVERDIDRPARRAAHGQLVVGGAERLEHVARALPPMLLVEGQRAIDGGHEGGTRVGQRPSPATARDPSSRRASCRTPFFFSCTRRPEMARKSTAPTAKMSERASIWSGCPRACSGAMYPGGSHDDSHRRGDERDCPVANAREPEIEELGVTGSGDEDVPRLDVAMDDARWRAPPRAPRALAR